MSSSDPDPTPSDGADDNQDTNEFKAQVALGTAPKIKVVIQQTIHVTLPIEITVETEAHSLELAQKQYEAMGLKQRASLIAAGLDKQYANYYLMRPGKDAQVMFFKAVLNAAADPLIIWENTPGE